MKAMVTGSEGFVGSALCLELEQNGYEVIRCSLEGGPGFFQLDVLDKEQVRCMVDQQQPDVIFHLAGQANVALSWKRPQLTMDLNVNGMVNLLEAVREVRHSIRVVGAGSSDEYGVMGQNGENVTEDSSLNPVTPYAISKMAQEKMAFVYGSAYDLNVCMVRCFNLCGPGQAKGFMIPDFASGIAEIENGIRSELPVGNLESSRDFTDVRDAARAYRYIGEKGKSGEVYNLCSGKAYSAGQILKVLCDMSKVPVAVRQEASRMRPSDTPVVYGNHAKLTGQTGWEPVYSIEETLKEILDYWRKKQ